MNPTRRHFLRVSAAAAGVSTLFTRRSHAQTQQSPDQFDPRIHAYGFRNWSPRTQYFEAPADPTHASIQSRIRSEWRDHAQAFLGIEIEQFPNRLIEAIATDLRAALVQRAGTNGHCYGMTLTAQQYFEDPATIPVPLRHASEINDPTVPLDEPEAPVYEDIIHRQAEQFLRFRAWLGRRAMFRPDWIDVPQLLSDIEVVIDRFGTASLSLFDSNVEGHQVLAYDYQDEGDTISIPIYDPNRTAASYAANPSILRFDRASGTPAMRPYGRYTHVLFNRYDQIDRATDRSLVSPLDHFHIDAAMVRESLFPFVLVLVDTTAVDLTVRSPNGSSLDRIRATHMERRRCIYPRIRTLYGAEPGTYYVSVSGNESTAFELTAIVAEPDTVALDTTFEGEVAVGEHHDFQLTVLQRGTGRLRQENTRFRSPAVSGGVGVLAGAALGAAGHRTLRQRQHQDRDVNE